MCKEAIVTEYTRSVCQQQKTQISAIAEPNWAFARFQIWKNLKFWKIYQVGTYIKIPIPPINFLLLPWVVENQQINTKFQKSHYWKSDAGHLWK